MQDESYQVSSFLRKTFLMISKGFQAQCESEAFTVLCVCVRAHAYMCVCTYVFEMSMHVLQNTYLAFR